MNGSGLAAFLVVLSYAPVAAQEGELRAPYDIRATRSELAAEYFREVEAIEASVRAGRLSAADGLVEVRRLNEQRFATARSRGAEFGARLTEIVDDARRARGESASAYNLRTARTSRNVDPGWVDPGNTGTPLTDPRSRGVFGDQDLTFTSDADRAAFVRACEKRGYHVDGRLGEGYVTVRELDIVAHGPTPIPKNPLDQQARLQTAELVAGHETYATPGARTQYIPTEANEWTERDALGRVADNVKKAERELRRNPAELSNWSETEAWAQGLSKATGRAMDAGGLDASRLEKALDSARAAGRPAAEIDGLASDLAFRRQLDALKSGMDPRAAGLVPVGASAEERARILARFQQSCLERFHQAYVSGTENNRVLIAEMDARITSLRARGDRAAAELVAIERARILDADAQALQYLVTHPEDHGRLMAEIVRGSRLEPIETAEGLRFRDAGGRMLTEQEALGGARAAVDDLRARTRKGPAGPAGMTRLERGALWVGAIVAGIEGARKEVEAAQREGRDPRESLAVLRAWLEFTGIPAAYETGQEISRDQIRRLLDEVEQKIQRGEDPNLIWAGQAHAAMLLARVAGALTGVSSTLEGGEEFMKLLAADMQRPPADLDALVRERGAKLTESVVAAIAELQAVEAEIASLMARAGEALPAMEEARLELFKLESRLESVEAKIEEIAEVCTRAREQRERLVALIAGLDEPFGECERLTLEVETLAEATCAAARDGGSVAAENHLRNAREAARTADETERRARRACEELEREAREFTRDDERLRTLLATTRPAHLLAQAPVLVERIRAAGAATAKPLEAAGSLTVRAQAQAAALRRRVGMLQHAGYALERSNALDAEVAGLEERIRASRALGTGDVVNTTVARAYERLEAIEALGAEVHDAAWVRACPEPPAPFDAGEIARRTARLDRWREARASAITRAQGCVGRMRSSLTISDCYTARDAAGTERATKFPPEEAFHLHTLLQAVPAAAPDAQPGTAIVAVRVRRPDGSMVTPRDVSLTVPVAGGALRATHRLRFTATSPVGLYEAAVEVRLGDAVVANGQAIFELAEARTVVGTVIAAVSPEATTPVSSFARGTTVHLSVPVLLYALDSAVDVSAAWTLTSTDGRTQTLPPSAVRAQPGESPVEVRLRSSFATVSSTALGAYTASCVVKVLDRSFDAPPATFEIASPANAAELRITRGAGLEEPLARLRPGDPFAFRIRYGAGSADGTPLEFGLAVAGPQGPLPMFDALWSEPAEHDGGIAERAGLLPEGLPEGTYTVMARVANPNEVPVQLQKTFTVVWPIAFDATWVADPATPTNPVSRARGGDTLRCIATYRFTEVRPEDTYSSWFEGRFGGAPYAALCSPLFGPGAAQEGPAYTSNDARLPRDAAEGWYDLNVVVRVGTARYWGPLAGFAVERTTEIAIESPLPGFHVTEKVIEVRGTVSDPRISQGVLVTNGQQAPMKIDQGRFSARTVLRPGENRIAVGVRTERGDMWAETNGTADIAAAALKIVLVWDAPTADIDLWVTDPEGQTTNYHSKRPAAGRSLDIDDTNGPGQETYTVETPMRGRYVVAVHYFAQHSHRGSVPFSMQVSRFETTVSESHETLQGVVDHEAADRDEAGAVAWFQIFL